MLHTLSIKKSIIPINGDSLIHKTGNDTPVAKGDVLAVNEITDDSGVATGNQYYFKVLDIVNHDAFKSGWCLIKVKGIDDPFAENKPVESK